ncbi:hypothetical protein [Shimia sp. FJ5]|uniref:hypothetical protein n=1 Tax=Shimia sp. FJ5 TaxID=3079054 RepID=UPI0026078A6F|nr:hypothetical protein [Shimia sp. FJ5]MDV4143859.1 hypothetical protein [Shimia sp. FJ5]
MQSILKKYFWSFTVVALSLCSGPASADLYKWSGNGTDWCAQAAKYLEPVGGRPAFTCDSNGDMRTGIKRLCVRLNNYGCMWQRSGSWPGTDMKAGNDGAHDGRGGRNGHSVFRSAPASLAAKFNWFARRGSKSAIAHAESYLPWCDTLGSKPKKGSYYRSCKLDPSDMKPGRKYCRKPASGKPSAAQCKSCNCPSVLAREWVSDTPYAVSDPLPLVDDDGFPNALMIKIALRNSVNEMGGYRPNQTAIDEAIALYPKLYGQ